MPCSLYRTVAEKDRTGVLVALVLMLLGVKDQDIIDDYALTTVGLKTLIPILEAKMKTMHVVYQENMQGARSMDSSRPETMAAPLRMIRQEYGGAEGYLKSHTTLNDNNIRMLRGNLIIQTQ
ncbi:hypothetical protein V5O48_006405 [Marasmius crinis-equi]|uniref:Uncharacterized protein n=1 Tax=Marasmius crinis-equi TaxID=585013 RepID=A0ABR3FJJ3_9AGAR